MMAAILRTKIGLLIRGTFMGQLKNWNISGYRSKTVVNEASNDGDRSMRFMVYVPVLETETTYLLTFWGN